MKRIRLRQGRFREEWSEGTLWQNHGGMNKNIMLLEAIAHPGHQQRHDQPMAQATRTGFHQGTVG